MPDSLVSLVSPERLPDPALPRCSPALDVIAVHRAADERVDEIYGLLARLDGGLLALRAIGQSVCAGPDEWNKLRFVIDGISDIADELLTANDAVTSAIDPLNSTVLSDGSSQ